MSNLAVDAAFSQTQRLRGHPFKRVLRRTEARVGDDRSIQRLSLSSAGYLYKREGVGDRQQASAATEERSLRVAPDQLVINPMWLTGGSIAVSKLHGAVSPDYRVFEASRDHLDPRYLHHLLRSQPYRDQYNLFVRANTTFDRRIQQDDLDQLPLWLPEVVEQRRIADFLDDRVARIDHVIRLRTMQSAALTERMASAITRATTPHDDRNGHFVKFSRAVRLNDGLVDPQVEPYVDMPLVAPNHIEKGTGRILYLESARDQGAVSGKGLVRAGQLIYSKIRPALRKAAIAPVDCLCSADAYGLTPIADVATADYFLAVMLGDYFSQQVVEASERVAMPKVNRDTLGDVSVWLPSLPEQRMIAHELSAFRSEHETVTHGLAASIVLLQELKQSLITAAVTGEIDVTTAGSGIPG